MDTHRPCDLNWELFKGSYYFSNNFFDNNSFTVFVFFFAFFYILSLNFSFISVYINLLSFICKNLYTGCVSSFLADINYCTHGAIHILAICIIRGEHHFCTNIYYQGLFRKTYIFNILISHIALNNSPKFLFCFFIQSSHVCLIDFICLCIRSNKIRSLFHQITTLIAFQIRNHILKIPTIFYIIQNAKKFCIFLSANFF